MGFFSRKKPESRDPDTLTEEGMQYMQRGNTEAAIKSFSAAVEIDPQHGQAWYGKGCAHGELEQFEEAIAAYQQSVKFAGEHVALPLFNLGNTYQHLERYQEAARCFQQAVEVDPTMADAWINLGRLIDDAGGHDTALECYDAALKIEPNDSMAWSNRGNSLRSLQRFSEALESYRKALQFDANDVAARIGVGVCQIECDQIEEGLASLEKAVEDTRHPMALFEFATALAKAGVFEAAASIFEVLIENEFISPQIFNNRGECLAQMNEIEAALANFDRAIELESEFAPAWFGKARVLVNADRIDEARPVAERYLQLADEAERLEPASQALAQACNISL